jgi:hypothetical protein
MIRSIIFPIVGKKECFWLAVAGFFFIFSHKTQSDAWRWHIIQQVAGNVKLPAARPAEKVAE